MSETDIDARLHETTVILLQRIRDLDARLEVLCRMIATDDRELPDFPGLDWAQRVRLTAAALLESRDLLPLLDEADGITADSAADAPAAAIRNLLSRASTRPPE